MPKKAEIGDWGVQTEYLSATVKPGDDFFSYVNESWLKQAEFPTGLPRVDAFVDLSLKAEANIRGIIADATKKPETQNQQFIAALYSSYMDVDRLNALGVRPIHPKLDAVFAADSHDDIVLMMQQPGWLTPHTLRTAKPMLCICMTCSPWRVVMIK